jgi:hypothetical protein
MNIKNAKNSTGFKAGISGLIFALVYVGLEFRNGFPEAISLWGEANTITVWHFPLIWLLGIFLLRVYAVEIINEGKRTSNHFQRQCSCGCPPRIVLVITYARRATAILW